jgi:hypothetical protein
MATEAQLRANRLNGRRSTGPRTADGKERTKFNALKHGLTSLHVVLPGEEEVLYQELRGALFAQYQPENPSETFLVDQLAQNWWRLNRSRRIETGMLSHLHPDSDEPGPTPADLDHLRRYEAAIERAYYRAYDRIEKIVARRPAPQPEEPEELEPIGSVSQNDPQPGQSAEPVHTPSGYCLSRAEENDTPPFASPGDSGASPAETQ